MYFRAILLTALTFAARSAAACPMVHSNLLIIPVSIAYLFIVYLLLTVAQRSSRVSRPRQ